MKKLIFALLIFFTGFNVDAQININGRVYNVLGNYNQHRGLTTDSNFNAPRVIPTYGFRKGAVMADTTLGILRVFNGTDWVWQVGISNVLIVNGAGADPDTLKQVYLGDTLTVGIITGSAASLAWADITGKPTTLAGYGITDPIVLTSSSYSDPAWITSLAWWKITGAPAFLTSESDPVYSASSWFGTTNNASNWNTAYTDRNKWDGGATGLTASTGRASLGATTVGEGLFMLTNPSAIRFIRINADNSVSTRTAAEMLSDLGAASLAGTETLTNKTLTTPTVTSQKHTVQALTDGATITCDMANGDVATVTLGGNRTLAFSNLQSGQFITIIITQDGTGGRTLTLPASTKVINGGAGAVTLTTAASAVDILTFSYVGTTLYCNYGKNYN